jgi:hypothetical protein
MENETYEIYGYEGVYSIDKNGNVFNLKTNKKLKQRLSRGYLSCSLKKDGSYNTKTIHRLLAIQFIPNLSNKPYVDHIDRDRLNNKLSNLRWCTSSENQKNKKPRGSSLFLGVSIHKTNVKKINKKGELVTYYYSNRYIAHINNNGRYIHLGLFKCEIEAAKAYDSAAKLYHGDFANLNFK